MIGQWLEQNSSVSYAEYAGLIASVEYHYDPAYNCRYVEQTKIIDVARASTQHEYTEKEIQERVQASREHKGCLKHETRKIYKKGMYFDSCFCTFLLPNVDEYFSLVKAYNTRGALPSEIEQESAKTMEMIAILDGLIRSKEKEIADKPKPKISKKAVKRGRK